MTERAAPHRSRDASIDLLRGLVMCLMVLDHARDFATSTPFNATDPDRTHAALFFTRWVTHFCAPVFVLLAGAGAGLSSAAGKPRGALARFLVSRGLWLVVLELTLVRFGWFFDLDYHHTVGQVIWALGWSMVALGGLVYLPEVVITVFGAVLVMGHDALAPLDEALRGSPLWQILHRPGTVELAPGYTFRVVYPLVPWVGVMALGFVLGRRWRMLDRRALAVGGLALTAAFVVLRLVGVYGDPHPFASRPGVRAVYAFLDCQKYPPSLEYLLMTLGPALLFLGARRGRPLGRPGAILVVYGRAPLFFYLLHIPLVHLMTLPFRARAGLPLISSAFRHGLDLPLPVAYGLWIAALALLWWPTARWAELKATRRDWWLSYL